MDWRILGIAETKDKNEITRAYRERLAVTNPEDNPEEFMKLRQAYEEALRLADEKAVSPDTPVKAWGRRLEELYNCFATRNHLENWKELFSDPICSAFDTKDQIEDELLTFLTRCYDLDKDIWKYLNELYDFNGRRNELKDKYPPEFIDYVVIYGQFTTKRIPYGLFYPGTDEEKCNEYFGYYWSVFYKDENMELSMKKMEESPEKHPYGDIVLIMNSGLPIEEIIYKIKEIADRYPDNSWITAMLANVCNTAGKYEITHQYCENCLKKNPDDVNLIEQNVLAYVEEGNTDILEYVRDLFANPNISRLEDERLDALYNKVTALKIEQLEKKQKEGNISGEELLELAKCYAGMENFEKLEEILPQTDPNTDFFKYNRVAYILDIKNENYEEAIKALNNVIEIIENGDPDEETDKKRRAGLGPFMLDKVNLLYYMGAKEDAIKLLYEVFDNFKTDLRTLKYFFRTCLRLDQADLLEQCADIMIEKRPEWYDGYLCKAYAVYAGYGNRDGEALYWTDYAMFIYGGDLIAYLLKVRLLIQNEAYEEAEELLQMLDNNGLKDVEDVIYCRARLLDHSEKYDEALEMYESLYDRRGNFDCLFRICQEYLYRYLVLKETKTNYGEKKEIERLLEIAEEGLKLRPDHYGTRDYHAFILMRLKRTDEALEEYLELAKLPYHAEEIDERIAHIYFDNLRDNADKALEFFKKAKERGGEKFSDYYIGVCHYYLQQFDEAKLALEEMLEKEPDDTDVFRWLAFTYMALEENDKALEVTEKLAAAVASDTRDCSKKYELNLRILRRLGRFDEAVENAKKFKENGNFVDYNQFICDILVQAGKTEEAKEAAYEILKTGNDFDVACAVHTLISCFIIEDDEEMVQAVYDANGHRFGYMSDAITLLVSEYFGDFKTAIANVQKRIKKAKRNNDRDMTFLYNNIAEFYYRAGKPKMAKKYAGLMLENADEVLKGNIDILPMIRSRRIQPLAILGRYEEAEEEYKYCETAPKCICCDECGCRDILIFEAFVEETKGNFKKAYDICVKALETYPGETDFAIYKKYFAKKIEENKEENK